MLSRVSAGSDVCVTCVCQAGTDTAHTWHTHDLFLPNAGTLAARSASNAPLGMPYMQGHTSQ